MRTSPGEHGRVGRGGESEGGVSAQAITQNARTLYLTVDIRMVNWEERRHVEGLEALRSHTVQLVRVVRRSELHKGVEAQKHAPDEDLAAPIVDE